MTTGPSGVASATPHIAITDLRKGFRGRDGGWVPVLDGLTLDARDGELVSILGPSGSGKSTLLNIVAGLDKADGGTLAVEGRPLGAEDHPVAYMPQKDMLFPWRSVLENVTMPLELQGVAKRAARARATELLPQFGLESFADAYPFTLSGGMRQRAALLRTVIQDRSILLLDEPFGALDSLTRSAMQEFLLSIWSRFRRTILFITHDIREAVYLSDRVFVLSPRPARVALEVEIDLPRPRTLDVTVTPEFAQYEATLLRALAHQAAPA
ncbi:ABC transporter ATP-binding protein [Nocardioides caldifontis]|uniref:ABC transporter ATP-binding protein n=1 Tax=Nocardioides caldifontis TaxID=2588938 RepID=UPI0019395F07|nr:ABC transporter ATP-binding protein [Nocardioides caldifontis]